MSSGRIDRPLIEVIAVQALVPDALGVESEDRSLTAVVAETDRVARRGFGLLLLWVPVLSERPKIALVEQRIWELFGC
jgi:hypothetical protein